MKRHLVLFAVWLSALSNAAAQTQPRADQLRGLPGASPEATWCPGPPLTRAGAHTLTIGAQWTAAAPCYAHFNLAPPATVDPISVSKFAAPATVTLTPGAWQDDLYIYLQAPAFNGSSITRPQRIVVQTTQPSRVQCDNCIVETAAPGTRIFPAFAMPVGLARVEAGEIHPDLDPIINSHQLYIGADLGIAVRRDGPGMWIELSRTAAIAQAQTTAAQLAQGSLEAMRIRAMNAQPLPVARLDQLEQRFEALQRDYLEIVGRIPATPAQVEELNRNIEATQETIRYNTENAMQESANIRAEAEMRLQMIEDEFRRLALHVATDAKPGAPCKADGPIFGFHQAVALVCEQGTWRRFQTKR